jgi:hypothetical protein
MGNKKIHLVALAEWPCTGSHLLHTRKFLQSFEDHGYTYSEIKFANEIANISKGDIVYLSNHGFAATNIPTNLFEAISAQGAYQILWFWHEHLSLARDIFESRFVLTGEHFYKKPALAGHIRCWDLQQTIKEYLPLTFASSLHPSAIGSLKRTERYLAHFVGYGYKSEINRKLRLRFRGIKIQNTPPFITEEQRRSIFLSSKVALGWHSDDNIKNNVVVERVFEGLAFGNAVISDTPIAKEITEGIVEFGQTYEETKEFLLRVKKDELFRQKKMHDGLAWARSYGTYWHVAKRFVDHFES